MGELIEPASEPAPAEVLAILAPDYRTAQTVAEDRGLDPQRAGRDWIYVQDGHSILGRHPGRYVVRWPADGHGMSGDKLDAWDWMIRRGWRSADEVDG